MAVLRPLRVLIDNYPEGQTEEFDCPYHPKNLEMGSRKVPFGRVLYIEQDDFMENPPKKFFRLSEGKEVRLRYGYFIKCVGIEKNPSTGEVDTVHCTYDPETRSGFAPDGRKVNATIHWVSSAHAVPCEIRLYDRLFRVPDPMAEEEEYKTYLNPNSLEVVTTGMVEPSLRDVKQGQHFQFERLGYFVVDSVDNVFESIIFNRTVTLRDSWAKSMVKK
jgi:glutaminyl-tRNA synthetase